MIRSQFPQLAAGDVTLVSEGWDYVVHRVDDEWGFRFPRRVAVVPRTEREIAVVPALAERLPVGVPAPVFVGRAADGYPFPFYGARYLRGREATGRAVDPTALGAALHALHAPETLAAVGSGLAVDPLGRADMTVRLLRLGELDVDAPALVAAAEALPPALRTAVCHTDLHFRQLLVNGGALTGIVDWVDLCRSDPAVDISAPGAPSTLRPARRSSPRTAR